MRNPFFIRAGFLFLIIGIVGLLFPLSSTGLLGEATNETFQNLFSQPLLEGPTPQPVEGSEVALNENSSSPDHKEIKDRLVIPSINVDMPVIQSKDDRALLKGGWLSPWNPTPDKGGNTVIFGHRFKYLPPISNTFFSLDELKIGDEMTLTWQGKDYRYRMVGSKVVEPTEVSVLNPTENSQLTLITCTPLFTTKQRLVIIAELIN